VSHICQPSEGGKLKPGGSQSRPVWAKTRTRLKNSQKIKGLEAWLKQWSTSLISMKSRVQIPVLKKIKKLGVMVGTLHVCHPSNIRKFKIGGSWSKLAGA
jgi:hypothetical protein